jgi:hypothetical protein
MQQLVVVIWRNGFINQFKEAVIPITAKSKEILFEELKTVIEKCKVLELGSWYIATSDIDDLIVYTLKEWFDRNNKPYPLDAI